MKFEAEGQELTKFLTSLEQFVQTVKGQNNFENWDLETYRKILCQSAPHNGQSANLFKLAWNPLILSSAVALKTTLQRCMIL